MFNVNSRAGMLIRSDIELDSQSLARLPTGSVVAVLVERPDSRGNTRGLLSKPPGAWCTLLDVRGRTPGAYADGIPPRSFSSSTAAPQIEGGALQTPQSGGGGGGGGGVKKGWGALKQVVLSPRAIAPPTVALSLQPADVDVEGRIGHAACASGGLVYTFGGYLPPDMEPTEHCMAFDPNTATWVDVADLRTPRAMLGACAL